MTGDFAFQVHDKKNSQHEIVRRLQNFSEKKFRMFIGRYFKVVRLKVFWFKWKMTLSVFLAKNSIDSISGFFSLQGSNQEKVESIFFSTKVAWLREENENEDQN